MSRVQRYTGELATAWSVYQEALKEALALPEDQRDEEDLSARRALLKYVTIYILVNFGTVLKNEYICRTLVKNLGKTLAGQKKLRAAKEAKKQAEIDEARGKSRRPSQSKEAPAEEVSNLIRSPKAQSHRSRNLSYNEAFYFHYKTRQAFS